MMLWRFELVHIRYITQSIFQFSKNASKGFEYKLKNTTINIDHLFFSTVDCSEFRSGSGYLFSPDEFRLFN